ncbi:MAG: magnesium transporter [Tenericutes bacterium HGW-Tenericutes-6]|nr:MAG: magnesium transporter [Tenericutes bacterium HGW-Tenericutes-6]
MKKINFKHSDDAIKKVLKTIFAYDLAILYPSLDDDEKKRIIHLIGLDKLTDMFVELDVDDQCELLDFLEPKRQKSLLKNLESDDLKEFIEDIEDEEKRQHFIQLLPPLKKKTIELLLTYDEDLAASIMTTDFVTVNQSLSIKEATNKVVTTSKDADYIDTIFVVDDKNRMIGAVDLKTLIITRPQSSLDQIMMEDFHFVYEDDSIEKAIETVQDYDRNAIPVLNHEDQVIGIVTADDIFDEIIENAEDDYQRMALLSDHESTSSAFRRTKQRLPWLMIAVFLNLVIASFLSIFEATIEQITVLVLFQPLILGMAGNIGTQSLAVTILGLHLKEFDEKTLPKTHVMKELVIGTINSLLLALASLIFVNVFLGIINYQNTPNAMEIGIIVSIAIFTSMFISALMGVFVPLTLNKFNHDPSAASGPIMTTINDIVALVIYFGIATLVFL